MFFEKLMLWLPSQCNLCGVQGRHYPKNICIDCYQTLPILSHHCPQCAQLLPQNISCLACIKNTPPFERTYALFPYQPPIIKLVTLLKFKQALSHAKLFGDLLALKIKNEWYLERSLPDIIIPVPLHSKRLRERGFNQALEIARPIRQSLNIPIDIFGAIRSKHTVPQSDLTAIERKTNLENAFLIKHRYEGMSVAVVDDVMTTQYTMRAFCTALKRAGAARIDVWCCARAFTDVAPNLKTR